MSAPQHRNPVGLSLPELREVHRDVSETLEQIRYAIDVMQGEANHQNLLAALYTKALMLKLQVQADMERFK